MQFSLRTTTFDILGHENFKILKKGVQHPSYWVYAVVYIIVTPNYIKNQRAIMVVGSLGLGSHRKSFAPIN